MKEEPRLKTESREFSACLSILFHKNIKNSRLNSLFFNSCVLFNELRRAGAVDDDRILDLKKTELAYPVRFMKQLPFKPEYVDEMITNGTMCIIGIRKSDDNRIHYAACMEISDEYNIRIADELGNVSSLTDCGGIPEFLLWFVYLEPLDPEAPGDAVKIVRQAMSFVGLTDEPLLSNQIIFNDHYLGINAATPEDLWCATFVWDIFRLCGLSSLYLNGGKSQDCDEVLAWGQQEGLLVDTSAVRYGDIVLLSFSGSGLPEHIGIVTSVNPDGSVFTIEGNASEFEDIDGGHVNVRRRSTSIIAVLRPKYETRIEPKIPRDPEKFRNAVLVCKNERKKARENGAGGTDWPGRKARLDYPDVLQYVFEDIKDLICVLGTNGKTTTCRMIDTMLTASGIGHAHNREGANMKDGILTTLLLNYDDEGQVKEKTVLLEYDELAFSELSSVMNPGIILLTNIYPDQKHRLNNAETVTFLLLKAILDCPDAILCLNQDSAPCMQIAAAVPNRKIFYSVKNNTVYADGKVFQTGKTFDSSTYRYNAAAACAFACAYGIPADTAVSAIRNTHPAFGRMEILRQEKHTVLFEMLKNPAGFDAFLAYASEQKNRRILIMSLWDPNPVENRWMESVDFAPLFSLYSHVYISGPCVTTEYLLGYPSVKKLEEPDLFNRILESEQDITVLTDYDGNIAIHKLLAERGYLRPFWAD